jgi:hypothetical protein
MLRPGQTVALRSPPNEALIEAMLPDGYKAEPRPNGKDGHQDCRLKPMHGPGESYSDVIIRGARADGERALTPFCCAAFPSMRYRPGQCLETAPWSYLTCAPRC